MPKIVVDRVKALGVEKMVFLVGPALPHGATAAGVLGLEFIGGRQPVGGSRGGMVELT